MWSGSWAVFLGLFQNDLESWVGLDSQYPLLDLLLTSPLDHLIDPAEVVYHRRCGRNIRRSRRVLNYPFIHSRGLKVGVKALFALCLVKQHRHKAVAAGAVEALIDRLAEFEKCDSERALATVELLCRIPAGCAAFESHALTVPLLVKIILKITGRATEYAAGALLSLCSASEKAQRDAVAAGVLTQLLLLVQSDCTERAKRKAQMLRDSWPEDYNAKSDDFAGSDVVLF